jgi:transposase
VVEAERASAVNGTEGHIELKAPAKAKPSKKKGRRKKFPEDAPRIETVYELPEDQRICACGECMHAIGFESKTQLERLEVTVVHKIKRQKYACRSCEEMVITTPGPIQPIKKGLLGTGFLAHVIDERFQNHMPYHRLAQKYAREGLSISKSVLERSTTKCAELLAPLHEALKEEVLNHEIAFTDDTPVRTVQKQGPKDGRLWVYLSKQGHHYYDFTASRSGDGPKAIFGDYDGYIQADAFAGYDQLYGDDKATEVACWAHARRKFEAAEASDPVLSKEALDLIRRLYRIETLAKEHELEAEDLSALRKNRAGPIIQEIKAWLALQKARRLPSSPMGKAITYTQNQWDALNVYLEDGRLEIDNNAAERGMRPIAVGRKN